MINNRTPRSETLQQASDKGFSMMKRNMRWTLVIVAAFVVYTMLRTTPASVTLAKEAVEITYSDKSVTTLYYSDINEAILLEDADFGEPLTGGTRDGSGWSGKWHSDALGDYMLMIHPGLTYSIELVTDTNTYVISGTTDKETEVWYETIQSFIQPTSSGSTEERVPQQKR